MTGARELGSNEVAVLHVGVERGLALVVGAEVIDAQGWQIRTGLVSDVLHAGGVLAGVVAAKPLLEGSVVVLAPQTAAHLKNGGDCPAPVGQRPNRRRGGHSLRRAEVCAETAERGEVLLLQRGGVVNELWPCGLPAATQEGDGSFVGHLESSPAPSTYTRGGEQAAGGHNDDGTDVASMAAPASLETVRSAGLLRAVATAKWPATPPDLVVT